MWWHVLEVESSADEKTVKRAYAKIIRGIDQDTEIEKFTKINDAYRLAIKSFKKEIRSKLLLGDTNQSFYTSALTKIYNSPKRRLQAKYWRNLFACMTFKEEEEFGRSCGEFFNEHYALPIEVWTLINKNYPLNKQRSFKWKDLSQGNFAVSIRELEAMDSQEAVNFLEAKIKAFYAMLDKDYDLARTTIKTMIDQEVYDKQVMKWLMIALMARGDLDEVSATYKMIKLKFQSTFLIDFCYGGFLTSQGEYDKSLSILKEIGQSIDGGLLQCLIDENHYGLGKHNQENFSYMPWNELDALSKKDCIALSAGHYHRLDLESNRRGIFSRLRRE